MIVRWGLDELPSVLAELGAGRPLLVCSRRWAATDLPVTSRYAGVGPHADARGVAGALAAVQRDGADALVALGGGSAIDTAKAASAETGLPVVSIPTTYSGSEWTPFFGSRDHETGIKRAGAGAIVRGIVYEPALTLGLPRSESAGTALNALAHCAEALYTRGHGPDTDRDALAGARLIGEWLPAVLADGSDLDARTGLLRGAMHAGASLRAGMGVAHAMAQALGGRFALPHGAMNAIALPAGLRFNTEVAASEIARFADALGADDPIARIEQLATATGPTRLRERNVPRDELPAVAEAAAARPAAKANPRPAPPDAILELLEGVW
jgi:alcohol dehydrogenase class IV